MYMPIPKRPEYSVISLTCRTSRSARIMAAESLSCGFLNLRGVVTLRGVLGTDTS
jgi:hypothetical protein